MSVHMKKRTRVVRGGRHRSSRPKTFSSEEAAKTYAGANSITEYVLENMKSTSSETKKIRIIQK